MVKNNSVQKAVYESALRLLTRREHSQLELSRKLTAKDFEPEIINIVIAQLTEEGWQSDSRFAESFTRHRINQGFGELKIGAELNQRGIGVFDYDFVLDDLGVSWDDVLERVYQKKYLLSDTISFKEKAKRTRFMVQRGFSYQQIAALFQRLMIRLQ